MTPALRKYHRHVWFFMAGFLPVLLVAAVVVMPEKRPSPEQINAQPDALPTVLKTAASRLFVAKLRSDASSGEHQLEIELIRPLTSAAALVYMTAREDENPQEGTLLGSLSSQNIYRFKMGRSLSGQQYVQLFDPIKNTTIGGPKALTTTQNSIIQK